MREGGRGKSRMDNPETSPTFDTQDTRRRQVKKIVVLYSYALINKICLQ